MSFEQSGKITEVGIDSAFRTFLASVGRARSAPEATRLALGLIAEQFEFSVAILSDSDGQIITTFGVSNASHDDDIRNALMSEATSVNVAGEGECLVFKYDIGGFTKEMQLRVARPQQLSMQDGVDLLLFSKVLGLVCQSHWYVESERDLRLVQMRERQVFESIVEVQRLIAKSESIDVIVKTLAAQTKQLLGADAAGMVISAGELDKQVGVIDEEDLDWQIPAQVLEVAAEATRYEKIVEAEISHNFMRNVVLAVPMYESDGVIGSMFAQWPAGTELGPATEELMAAFVGQASLAFADAQISAALQASFTDSLTGLASRTVLLEAVEEALKSNAGAAFLFIDLDGFKAVNDSYGHSIGDKLLVTIAKRIKNSIRSIDLAGRLGGDEFAVLLREVDNIEIAVELAERMVASVTQPISVDGIQIEPKLSVGISQGDSISVDSFVNSADMAMYQAKKDSNTSVVTAE